MSVWVVHTWTCMDEWFVWVCVPKFLCFYVCLYVHSYVYMYVYTCWSLACVCLSVCVLLEKVVFLCFAAMVYSHYESAGDLADRTHGPTASCLSTQNPHQGCKGILTFTVYTVKRAWYWFFAQTIRAITLRPLWMKVSAKSVNVGVLVMVKPLSCILHIFLLILPPGLVWQWIFDLNIQA